MDLLSLWAQVHTQSAGDQNTLRLGWSTSQLNDTGLSNIILSIFPCISVSFAIYDSQYGCKVNLCMMVITVILPYSVFEACYSSCHLSLW